MRELSQNLNQILDYDPRFELDESARDRVEKGHKALLQLMVKDQVQIYGLHTHYGFNVKDKISKNDWRDHQRQLLEYLCVGVGEPLEERVVRLALRLQVMKVSQGRSGTHPKTLNRLIQLSHSHHLPKVPSMGSLGASGDLIPMAHAVRPIFEGHPVEGPRDVISLVNTNAMMSAYAATNFQRIEELLLASEKVLALNVFASGCDRGFLDPSLLREFHAYEYLENFLSRTNRYLRELGKPYFSKDHLQHPYSIRCAPQVFGLAWKSMMDSKKTIDAESKAIADNPILSEDGQSMLHGGLFYANGIAWASDQMNDVMGRIGELLDRQVLLMMDPNFSGGLSDNLGWGERIHCKGIHQLISSLHQDLRSRGLPSRMMSFSCESNNQDVVPCGMTAQNGVSKNLETFSEIVKASSFIGLRSFYERKQMALPESLMISEFHKFSLKKFDQLYSELVIN
ncbi:aromatic amino acid lyase [bacterium]|nr:aromatic amino acid lyase [bacterium]